MRTEALLNIPHVCYFATAGTPDAAVVTYSHTADTVATSAIIQHGATGHYQVHFTPTRIGTWMISVIDAGGAVLHSEQIECVNSLSYQRKFGAEPAQHDLAVIFPPNLHDSSGTQQAISLYTGATTKKVLHFERYCWRVPYRGWIYGITFYADEDINELDNCQFVTLHNTAGNIFHVRAASENIVGSKTWSTAWHTIYFDKPVWGEPGDCFGFWGENESGTRRTVTYARTPYAGTQDICEIWQIHSLLSMTGDNTALSWGTVRKLPEIMLVMAPPDLVITGDSVMAGYNSGGTHTATIFEAIGAPYNPADDIAAMISNRSQLVACNCADGGTAIVSWVGSTGLFVKNVLPLHPSLVSYTVSCNDAVSGTVTVDNYHLYLTRFQRHCFSIGSRMVLCEPPPCLYLHELDDGTAEKLDSLMAIARAWSEQNGVMFVAAHHALGVHSGDDEHAALRHSQSVGLSGIDAYYNDTDTTHMSRAGRTAFAVCLSSALQVGGLPARMIAPASDDDNVVYESTVATGEAATSAEVAAAHATTDTLVNSLNNLSDSDVAFALDTYDAAKASDITSAFTEIKGATWSSDTDTLEDVRNAVDGTGTGARAVTITVDDGSDPLEGARVRVAKGAESYVSTTDVSGQVAFSLDDGTWTVSITLAVYQFTPETLVVDGDETPTYSMSALSLPESEPGFVTGYLYCYDDDGVAAEGVTVYVKIYGFEGTNTGVVMDRTVRTSTSSATGLVTLANMLPGGVYQVSATSDEADWKIVSIAADAESPVALGSIVGTFSTE